MSSVIAALLVVLAGILIFASTKPDTFRVQRSISINAPPEKIFPLVNDFQNWSAWSPYEKRDPDMKKTYSGNASGTGSLYAWEGNSKVGQGQMEITDSSPSSKISLKLDFIKPFENHNVGAFTFEPQGDTTNVTWAMEGPNTYLSKVMSVFINMDNLIGKDFETGLATLKTIAEK